MAATDGGLKLKGKSPMIRGGAGERAMKLEVLRMARPAGLLSHSPR